MKNISNELQAALQAEVSTLATCWKMTRRDGAVLGFTDHDKDIVFDGVEFLARSGFTPTAIASSASLAVDNLDVEGMLDSESIIREDVLAGKYDFAEIEVFMVNFTDIEQGRIPLRLGWLGEITLQGGRFMAEVRGLTQKLSQSLGELYSAACRAELGDARCKIDMTSHRRTGAVTESETRNAFVDTTCTEVDGYFAGGKVVFSSGANAGQAMEIKEFTAGRFVLVLPMAAAIAAGDAYEASAGCDKSFGTCRTRFSNAINFRGEPHVPGLDRMLETSTTRSTW